jgi:hypothetical protein
MQHVQTHSRNQKQIQKKIEKLRQTQGRVTIRRSLCLPLTIKISSNPPLIMGTGRTFVESFISQACMLVNKKLYLVNFKLQV